MLFLRWKASNQTLAVRALSAHRLKETIGGIT